MPESALLTTRFIATWTLAAWLIAVAAFADSASLARADPSDSGQGLGSVDEYEQSAPPSADGYESPVLGLAVMNQTEWLGHSRWLEHGRWVSGVEILKVTPGGPGDSAGLQGSRLGVLQATILMTGFVASAFFPPAMMGMMALSKAVEPHEMIIAVDGKRTCDVIDFEEALEKAEAGEVVYLTVVRHDRREQIRLALPVQ
jgi:S1-C subfamily serine protease